MEESTTYQAILAEGRVKEAKAILLRMGRKRFGPPDEQTAAALERISSISRLEALSERLLDAAGWDDLLPPPRSQRRNGNRRPKP
jgi:hypothetical protein